MTERVVTDDTTMGEIAEWHAQDRPECPVRVLRFHLHDGSLECEACGWLFIDDPEERP